MGVYVGGVVAAVVVVLLVIILLAVALAILMQRTVKRRRRRTLRHRPSNHLLLKPQLVKDDAYINLCSPDIVKTGELDFPRQKLELQCELGTYMIFKSCLLILAAVAGCCHAYYQCDNILTAVIRISYYSCTTKDVQLYS